MIRYRGFTDWERGKLGARGTWGRGTSHNYHVHNFKRVGYDARNVASIHCDDLSFLLF